MYEKIDSISADFFHSEYRIWGPPGTGKTTALAANVKSAARRYGSDAVVAMSFTRTAAAELAARDTPLRREQIGTLHSFAFRALGDPEIAESRAKDWNDIVHDRHPNDWLICGSSKSASAVDEPFGDGQLGETLGRLNRLRARMIPTTSTEWDDDVLEFSREWSRWKTENNLLDFTDLIEHALADVPACPGYPAVGFFDEAQDFTALELALVRKWGARMRFFVLAGDDDQCIYAFKGATPLAFLHPAIEQDHKRFLRQSYRIPRAVHEEAARWTKHLVDREPKDYAPRLDAGGRAVEGAVDRELELGAFGEHIEALALKAEEVARSGRTCMLLTTCGYMLGGPAALRADGRKTHGVIDAMRRLGVPFHNPRRVTRGDWNPLRGAARRLASYLRPDRQTWGGESREWTWDEVWDWLEHVPAIGEKSPLLRGKKTFVREQASGEHKAERVPWAQIASMWKPGAQWWSGRPETLVDLWDAKHRDSLYYPLRVIARNGRPAIREEPKIITGTIHSVKGFEADVVFLAPDLSPRGAGEWCDGQGPESDRTRRMFYVGATRARERLVLLVPSATEAVAW